MATTKQTQKIVTKVFEKALNEIEQQVIRNNQIYQLEGGINFGDVKLVRIRVEYEFENTTAVTGSMPYVKFDGDKCSYRSNDDGSAIWETLET